MRKLLALLLLAFATGAGAQLSIEITGAGAQRIPIAIAPFAGEGALLQGNPEAIYIVTILPSYEVLKFSRRKSSGNQAYDDEVERAILKSSPLPRPDKPELFSRELQLTFHPKDR